MLQFFEHYSYLGLFLILLAEESGLPLPIPGDFFIATTASLSHANYFYVVLTVVTATIIGSTILFTLAKVLGHTLLLKFGKYVKITPRKILSIENFFSKYGGFAIIVGRLIPGLRIITPIIAGTFDLTYKSFFVYTAIAAFIWANIYFFVGKFFRELILTIVR